jgi:hypothetical protein
MRNLSPNNVKSIMDLKHFSPWIHNEGRYPSLPGSYNFLSNAEESRSIPYKKFEYHINDIGFRGKLPIDPTIGFFGCSFTFGEGVSDLDAFPTIVANSTNQSFLNLGMIGYSSQQIIQLFYAAAQLYKMKYAVITLPGPERFHYVNSENKHWPVYPNQDRDNVEHEQVRKALYSKFSIQHLWHDTKNAVVFGDLIAKHYGINVIWGSWHGHTCQIINNSIGQSSLKFDFDNYKLCKGDYIGRDNMHPGIVQHKEYANKIIARINMV